MEEGEATSTNNNNSNNNINNNNEEDINLNDQCIVPTSLGALLVP